MAKNDNLKDFLTDVADAIRAKKGTTDKINPQDFSAEIASIETSSGGGTAPVSKGDVTFYDYDGTVLHSYTKDEFLALSEMPSLPERLGLVCQGWNYTLEDAKAYVEEYGVLHIGAMYITDDGKTRLYITIPSKVVSEITIYFSLTTPNSLVIDWGDGVKDAVSGTGDNMNAIHKYEEVGDYVIAFEVAEGAIVEFKKAIFGSNRAYSNILKKSEIGNGVTTIDAGAFSGCYSLSSVVIPQGVTSIGSNVFSSCISLVILDFSESTSVPTLSSTSAIPTQAELRIIVPDDLYDTWIAATNWSSFASRIVKASEFNA